MVVIARAIVAVMLASLLPISSSDAADNIVVDGSTGVMPLIAALAKVYQQDNQNVTVELGRGLAPRERLEAVAEGKIDVALASHGISADELARRGLVAHEIAKIAVVFGVNRTVTIEQLTEPQVCDIYATKVTNWQDLGAASLPMAVRARPETEVDTEIVRARIECLRELKMSDAVKLMPKSGDMAKELSAVPGAIGFTTMTVVEQSAGRIRAVALNGIAPTPENVRSRAYKLTRDSLLITKAAPAAPVARFIAFMRTARAEETIAANGAIPVK